MGISTQAHSCPILEGTMLLPYKELNSAIPPLLYASSNNQTLQHNRSGSDTCFVIM